MIPYIQTVAAKGDSDNAALMYVNGKLYRETGFNNKYIPLYPDIDI
jgi:hypothetical protein